MRYVIRFVVDDRACYWTGGAEAVRASGAFQRAFTTETSSEACSWETQAAAERAWAGIKSCLSYPGPGKVIAIGDVNISIEQLRNALAALGSVRAQNLSAGELMALVSELDDPAESPAVPGIANSQEPKYTTDGQYIINRFTGIAIPPDEPVFIFRAKDRHALSALQYYQSQISSQGHFRAVGARIAEFIAWASAHNALMKEPDTSVGEAPLSQPLPAPDVADHAQLVHDHALMCSTIRHQLTLSHDVATFLRRIRDHLPFTTDELTILLSRLDTARADFNPEAASGASKPGQKVWTVTQAERLLCERLGMTWAPGHDLEQLVNALEDKGVGLSRSTVRTLEQLVTRYTADVARAQAASRASRKIPDWITDLDSHRGAWRSALQQLSRHPRTPGDITAYWRHELGAFDRMQRALTSYLEQQRPLTFDRHTASLDLVSGAARTGQQPSENGETHANRCPDLEAASSVVDALLALDHLQELVNAHVPITGQDWQILRNRINKLSPGG